MFNKEELVAGVIGTVGTVAGIGAAATGSSAAALTSGLAAAGHRYRRYGCDPACCWRSSVWCGEAGQKLL